MISSKLLMVCCSLRSLGCFSAMHFGIRKNHHWLLKLENHHHDLKFFSISHDKLQFNNTNNYLLTSSSSGKKENQEEDDVQQEEEEFDENIEHSDFEYVPPKYVNPEDLHPDRPIFDGHIPKEKLIISFSRSSGPGGQNVNKVNTKVDIRLPIDSSDWIPDIVKERLKELYANKINKEGELIIQASSFRTQDQNMKDGLHRLKGYIAEAYNIPKEWKPREGRTEKGDAIRLKDKKKHSEKKQRRQEGKRIRNIYDI
ncbi:hypothetical protein FDP41_010929 [Naegleria fowleri]|uniref:Prokaryotic-type class I peptide chain release factors domain-containing protein n=1 Tax=Naegleria fowleri TaxID=5763 RepID=A0A6A5CBC8_NAEFO|nr:uncharacterized protein FDP41_010929 [Naegleria fowleri]KAF0982950.1 hypothetical protein FDP41_010929 [Naegleria fowleri]CAG4710355.1 unnamed protein product [Naegleria fowleri]